MGWRIAGWPTRDRSSIQSRSGQALATGDLRMNLKPIVPYRDLKNADPALRKVSDAFQNTARFAKTAAHNAVKVPTNLLRWHTGVAPSWAPFKTNRQLRRELRNQMDQLEQDRFQRVKEDNCVE